ncbi:zf-CCHC domain-containing protein [Tanacetum coccineum]
MAQENYIEGCSMQRPPLLELNGVSFWKARFKTYVKSKDINLWQVIQNDDFYYEVEDSKTKLMKEMPYVLLEDDQKKKLGKNNEAKMTLYNALLHIEYVRILMCKTAKEVWHTLIITHQGNSQVLNYKIDLLTQEYEKFSISHEETINNGFIRFNVIVTSLKSLDPNYSSNNHVRKFLRAIPLKWRAKTTKEKVKSLALKANVTRVKTSDDSDSQGGSDEDVDEEEATSFNLLARNFGKFFCKGNRFRRRNRFGKGRNNVFGNKSGESSMPKGAFYNCGIEGHFSSECRRPKENKAFVGGAWSDSEDDEHQNEATCPMEIDSQEVLSKPSSYNIDLNIVDLKKENEELLKFNQDFTKTFEKLLKEKHFLENKNSKLSSKIDDLEIEVKKLAYNKEVIEPCKTCDVLTKEVDSLKCNVSKLQDEALKFSKFKESSIALDDMLSRKKLSEDKTIGLWILLDTKHMNWDMKLVLLLCKRRDEGGHDYFRSNQRAM